MKRWRSEILLDFQNLPLKPNTCFGGRRKLHGRHNCFRYDLEAETDTTLKKILKLLEVACLTVRNSDRVCIRDYPHFGHTSGPEKELPVTKSLPQHSNLPFRLCFKLVPGKDRKLEKDSKTRVRYLKTDAS
jgi:hypothetical protein